MIHANAHVRRHTLRVDGMDRESLVWVAPVPSAGLAVVVYTWVDGHHEAGTAAMAFGSGVGAEQVFEVVDKVSVDPTADFDAWTVGPCELVLDADGGSRVRFVGEEIDVDLTFSGSHDAYAYSSHPDGCPTFFADDRVEQAGLIVGRASVRGREFTLDGPGQRDHSWGRRDWAAMTHMKWFNVMSDAAAVHLVELQAFGQTFIRGYVARGTEVSPIAAADLRPVFDSRLMYEQAWGRITDADGQTVEFELDGDPRTFVWQVHPRLRLHDSLLAGTLDGSPATAYADASWETCYVDHHQSRLTT